jgi:hypothetical protein
MQVRHQVAVQIDVHFDGRKNTIERPGCAYEILEEERLLAWGRVVRLGHMPCADQDRVAGHALVTHEAQVAELQASDDKSFLGGRRANLRTCGALFPTTEATETDWPVHPFLFPRCWSGIRTNRGFFQPHLA